MPCFDVRNFPSVIESSNGSNRNAGTRFEFLNVHELWLVHITYHLNFAVNYGNTSGLRYDRKNRKYGK
jgi:hypothetical protein